MLDPPLVCAIEFCLLYICTALGRPDMTLIVFCLGELYMTWLYWTWIIPMITLSSLVLAVLDHIKDDDLGAVMCTATASLAIHSWSALVYVTCDRFLPDYTSIVYSVAYLGAIVFTLACWICQIYYIMPRGRNVQVDATTPVAIPPQRKHRKET